MATESSHCHVDQYMRVIGLMEIWQGKDDYSYIHEDQIMRVSSLEIAVMVMAPKLGRMEVSTLEIGKKIKEMEEGL